MFYYECAIIGARAPFFTYASSEPCAKGEQVSVPLRNRQNEAVVINKVEKPEFACKELVKSRFYFSHEQFESAKFISEYYVSSLGEAVALFEPFSKESHSTDSTPININIELSSAQKEAYAFLQKEQVGLLFGDTGSGKTEIYIKLIEQALNDGKSAIFLMPEISLTPQMERRLKKQFGERVAIWHSKVTKKRKSEILVGIAAGEIRLVAGARSALFLPLPKMGLIVVDEEHDDSYKSQSSPRYNARDVAIYMAKRFDYKAVLGSATPLATSYYRYPHHRLKGSYHGSKNRIIFEDEICELTPKTVSLIEERLTKKEQTIIFLPTRANFKYLLCKSCGKSVECPFCSVSMSVHKSINALKCHYCGYVQKIVDECPSCGSAEFESQRYGTAEMVEILEQKFSSATIQRFDKDAVKSEAKLKEILKNFNDGKIDILVGTQMLSKGHDYHGVTLAVILGIDYVLRAADFRSQEKAFALLLQIIGRSGRKSEGVALVQTKNRELFGKLDYEEFVKKELSFRVPHYPPFKRVAQVGISDKDKTRGESRLNRLVQDIKKFKDIEIVGSGASPIERIGGKYRFFLFLRSEKPTTLSAVLRQFVLDDYEIDIDPTNFL